MNPEIPRPVLRRTEIAFAYAFFLGAASTFIQIFLDVFVHPITRTEIYFGIFGSPLGNGITDVYTGAPILLWFAGMGGLAYLSFRHTSKKAVAVHVGRTDPLRIEYIDGIMSAGAHREILLWWETPPRLLLDSSLRSMPTFNAFLIWLGNLRLRLIRTPDTQSRWGKFVLLHLGESFGVLYAYYIVSSSRKRNGAE